MLGADLFVDMLIGYDVEKVFGVPGDTNVSLYMALGRRSREIQHVMARDERSSGFMADAYARVSNRVGVFEAPSGAGAMYALPAVAEANSSSLAVILFTIDIPLKGEGRGVITELDCVSLFKPITKASIQIKSADKIAEVVRRAFRIATTGRPGAVHVVVPEDILLAEVDLQTISKHTEQHCQKFPAYPVMPSEYDLDKLLDIIGNASRPLIIAGGGVNRAGAGAALVKFVEQQNIPVVTTMTGQGAIPDHHTLSIGVIGDNGFHPHANKALEDADLVLYVGSKVGSVVTVGWTLPVVNSTRQVAQIDIDPEVLANNYETIISLAGDARVTFEALLRKSADRAPSENSWVALLNKYREEFWRVSELAVEVNAVPLQPELVVDTFSRHLKEPVNILSDAGTPTPYMTRYLRLRDPASRIFIPRAYGGLGYAIPAVIGAWYADPEKRPIGLFGDGSLGMSVGELESLVRLNVPAILLHFNNACFGWIKGLHKLADKGRTDYLSVDFNPSDASRIAEAFGLRAWSAETIEEFENTLSEAFQCAGPCLIDIHIESLADRLPPVWSWMVKQGVDPQTVDSTVLAY